MKRLIFLIVLIVFSFNSYAQIRMGALNIKQSTNKKEVEKNRRNFLNQKTLFVFPGFFPKTTFENILNEVWDATTFEVVMESEFNDSEVKPGDAIVRYRRINTLYDGDLGSTYCLLEFQNIESTYQIENETKWRSFKVATVFYTPRIITPDDKKTLVDDPKFEIMNFNAGYLKNHLQTINNALKKNLSIEVYNSYEKDELEQLKRKTLYVDNTVLYRINALSGKEKDAPQIEDLFKDYPYKYEVVDSEYIDKLIFEKESVDFYYLAYNQINPNKIISVVNGKTGAIIYHEHTGFTYNIKSKDIKELSNHIKKTK